MARALNRLTVKKAASETKPGMHADGGGLYLRITKAGSKAWVFVYHVKRGDDSRRREKGLGSLNAVSLDEARTKRDEAKRLLAAGKDPIDHRDRPEELPTFGAVATDLIETLEVGWKNPKHRQQWRNTLENYCAPIWSRPVDLVETPDIIAILTPIWNDKPETASRLRGRIERVLDAAKVRGFRTGENPARWKGHLQLILPGKTRGPRRHHPALPYDQVADFVRGLHTRISTAARALEFLIYTAARTNEVINSVWRDVDLEAKTWTIPAERMKMGREHVVPLTEPAITVLRAMAIAGMKPQAPIFPSRNGKHLSNMAMEQLLRRMGCENFVVHGFRSSFRDWAGDKTNFPREVAEAALAHQVGNAVEQSYRRGSALEKRRALMAAWSAYLTA